MDTPEYWLNYYNLTGDEILRQKYDDAILPAKKWAENHAMWNLGHDEWDFEDVTEKLKSGELVAQTKWDSVAGIDYCYDVAELSKKVC